QGPARRAGDRGGSDLHDQLRQGAAALSRGGRGLLGAQPACPCGDRRPVTARGAVPILLLAVAGCATRSQVVQQHRQVRGMVQDQGRQLQEVQRELERLRADVEEGQPRRAGGAPVEDRLTVLEQRIAELERATGTPSPATPTTPGATPTPTPPPV